MIALSYPPHFMKYLALLFVMGGLVAVRAQTNVPTIVSDWLGVYQKSGEQEAMAAWFKGSPIESDTNATVNIAGLFTRMETAYGKMTGFEPIRTVAVAPSYQRVYVLIKYERSPLFAWFDCYKINGSWAVTTVDFNIKASAILPEPVLGGQP